MIREELLNEGTLVKHYSDIGKLILQVETGIKYSEAIDTVPCRYTYVETDDLAEEDTSAEEFDDTTTI